MVINTATSAPIRKATVSLNSSRGGFGDEGQTATTDAEGKFAFADLAPGEYQISASHPSFVSVRRRGGRGILRGATSTYSLTPGQQIKDIVLKLTPGAVLRGHVADEDGDPVAHAEVQVIAADKAESAREAALARAMAMLAGGGSTDDQGDFRISSVAPGRYYLKVSPPIDVNHIGARQPKGEEHAYVPTFYPGTTRRETASLVDLHAGDDISLNISLRRGSLYPVSGTLMGTKGLVAQGMVIAMQGTNTTKTAPVKDGKFDLRLPIGHYTLMAIGIDGDFSPENLMAARAHKAIDVTESGLHDVALALGADKSATQITGRVRAQSGTLPADVRMMVFLRRMDPKQDDDEDIFVSQDNGGGFGQVKSDGTFEMKNVRPGTYEVGVGAISNKMDEWYTKAVVVGTRDVLNSGLTVSGSALTVEIVVSPEGAVVEGIVRDRDQHASTDAFVVLVPDAARARRHSLYETSSTDQNGHFVMRGIEPGDYTVYAFSDIEDNAWFDAHAMQRYSSDGAKVTLRAGEKTEIQVKLVSPPQNQGAQ